MQSGEIRQKYLDFFENRGHAVVPSASLVPEGDSSTLFTTAGMQPFVPYLLGQKHPKGKRIVNVQKCLRTGDIDEVGDNTHLTFFEMLGNWSLGDYWKKEAIEWSYEFLTSEKEGLGLDPSRLYITVFEGTNKVPRDEESVEYWKEVGVPENRIYYRGKDNFWSPGDNGPCGPSTEMFYDLTGELGDMSSEKFEQADEDQEVVEIWNDVFMAYEKKGGEVVGELKQKNVDTGMGLERAAAVMQKVDSPYETDLFTPILEVVPGGDEKARRIIADHIRSAVFAIADDVEPSNTDKGYIVRRLIRRAVRYAQKLESVDVLTDVITSVITKYKSVYPEVDNTKIIDVIDKEIEKFNKISFTDAQRKELRKIAIPTLTLIEEGKSSDGLKPLAERIFFYSSTHGIPVETVFDETQAILEEFPWFELNIKQKKRVKNELNNLVNKEFMKHQEKSKTASVGKFKGGLADSSEETVKLHTAHHLLLAALQKVLGGEVKQRGSNITQERLRIDFTFDRKLTDDEKVEVENQVNEWIAEDLKVVRREMPLEEAKKIGAEMEFGAKYPDKVSVYFIEGKDGNVISKEFCGGPHVENTREFGFFKIKKEQASSKGVRRIKAVLE